MPNNPSRNQPQRASKTQAMMSSYHTHNPLPNQCGSSLVQSIDAPLPLVWSMVRRFAHPEAYKQFIKSCTMRAGDGGIGSVREVMLISGFPAETSTERLEKLDDDMHVMMFRIIGGDINHRLVNFCSTTTLHEDEEVEGAMRRTVVIESYVVDVPVGSSEEDTCVFVDTVVGCNLRSLAKITEKMALKGQGV
ncbi:hypothetical protein L1049_009582 [Liquidambar formosana]|uniref:Uncharacterized protein n=1 Tax=Liquidambar formosana TaxID=63359 RepID=A0AAP0R082_LIQFO